MNFAPQPPAKNLNLIKLTESLFETQILYVSIITIKYIGTSKEVIRYRNLFKFLVIN